MPAAKKPPTQTSIKPKTTKKKVTKATSQVWYRRYFFAQKNRLHSYLRRRPHRSLRRTRRRDYVRPLAIPGYFAFTGYVAKTIWQHRKTFLLLAVLYALLSGLLAGLGSQDAYTQLGELVKQGGEGIVGNLGQASLLLVAAVGGALNNTNATDAQKVFGFLLGLLLWMTVVWLLRAYQAGTAPRLRDGLYSSGSPLLATFSVAMIGVVQLLPIAIAMIGFAAASSYGLFDGGLPAMLFWVVAALLTCLSLYWLTSTFIAMVVVTLPGMYPMRAIKIAGDLVVGRRVRILLRLVWMFFVTIVAWAIIMVPIILAVNWLTSIWKQVAWVPFVPLSLLVMSTLTLIWISSYVYLLYRKVVDDDTEPA